MISKSITKYISIFFLALLVSNCASTENSNDNVQYRNNLIPVAPYNPYYYQQQAPVQQVAPVNPYVYQQQQVVPASRYYANPYAIQQQIQPPIPYYDSDQYYVAPTYYGTTDIDVPDSGFEKF